MRLAIVNLGNGTWAMEVATEGEPLTIASDGSTVSDATRQQVNAFIEFINKEYEECLKLPVPSA